MIVVFVKLLLLLPSKIEIAGFLLLLTVLLNKTLFVLIVILIPEPFTPWNILSVKLLLLLPLRISIPMPWPVFAIPIAVFPIKLCEPVVILKPTPAAPVAVPVLVAIRVLLIKILSVELD